MLTKPMRFFWQNALRVFIFRLRDFSQELVLECILSPKCCNKCVFFELVRLKKQIRRALLQRNLLHFDRLLSTESTFNFSIQTKNNVSNLIMTVTTKTQTALTVGGWLWWAGPMSEEQFHQHQIRIDIMQHLITLLLRRLSILQFSGALSRFFATSTANADRTWSIFFKFTFA